VFHALEALHALRGFLFVEGKVTDATFRTHVLRIEEVPLNSAFAFCRIFFRSETLLDELIAGLGAPSSGGL
jgi:hypothetical protein